VLFNFPPIQPDQPDQYNSILKSVFRDYEESLKREISTLRGYKKKNLVARGGLLYPEFNENGGKNTIRDIRFSSKLFHLTYIFHHFTHNRLNLGPPPNKMPQFGTPHYDLTAKILNEDSDKIKKHINRLVNNGVYIKPWPILL